MKTLKTSLIAILLGALTIQSAVFGQTKYADAETLATAYLRTKTAYYALIVGARNPDTDTWMEMEYTMDAKSGLITNFTYFGTNIPLVKPLVGLPIPTNGYRDFNMTVVGFDGSRERSCHGNMYTNALLRGDSIIVSVLPEIPPAFIPFVNEDPYSYNLFIDGPTMGYYYDWSRKGFVVWLEGITRAGYKIVHQATKIVPPGGVGIVDVSKGTEAPQESPVNVRFIEGIVDVSMAEPGYQYFSKQSFDSTVIRARGEVAAKVFAVRDIGRRTMYIWLNHAGQVEVRSADNDTVLSMAVIYRSDNLIGYRVDAPLDNARITVFPDGLPATDSTFEINIGY